MNLLEEFDVIPHGPADVELDEIKIEVKEERLVTIPLESEEERPRKRGCCSKCTIF